MNNYAPRHVTIEEIAGKYIKEIKSLQPQGPYFVIGWSIGGTIAFEMVRQLEQMQEKISFLILIDSPPPRVYSNKSVSELTFTLEIEKNFIKKYLPNKELEKELENTNEINDLWSVVVDYLTTDDFEPELIKKTIVKYEAHVVPNYHQLKIPQLIKYLNTGRTFSYARNLYIPPGKIHTTVHYLAASQSKNIIKQNWADYCGLPINFYEIPGDHYSIFRMPDAAKFAKVFNEILKGFYDIFG